MIEGLLRHCTDAEVEANYTDTHRASVVGFAFTELLGFRLLPRLKNIGAIKLYSPDDPPPPHLRGGAGSAARRSPSSRSLGIRSTSSCSGRPSTSRILHESSSQAIDEYNRDRRYNCYESVVTTGALISVLAYAIGGACIALGALHTGWDMLSLTTGPIWSRRFRQVACSSPATEPGKRRRAWNNVGANFGLVVTGIILILSTNDVIPSLLASIVIAALVIWQLGALVTNVRHRYLA